MPTKIETVKAQPHIVSTEARKFRAKMKINSKCIVRSCKKFYIRLVKKE